ncbi:MAG TPA: lamin tail domain-containing protein, partial [Candidatus Paceibacterota bacterium]|nr:lamin tail domain-containing protein [Candidatus Paceibacterota bacterium]
TGAAVDLGGWKLHKRSGTGADYSLRTIPAGSAIAAGGYFTWANSAGGFADLVGADISSSETLSAGNSVALFDADGAVVDELAWGGGVNQYVEGDPYPTDPEANQVLARKQSGGAMVDTGDNASDFFIQ